MRIFLLAAVAAASLSIFAQTPAASGQSTPQQPSEPNQPPGAGGKAPPGAAGQTPGGAAPSQPQSTATDAGTAPATSNQPANTAAPQPAAAGAMSLDLTGALDRARAYNQQFITASIAAASAHEDRVQAKAALLPSLNALNQYIYTQGNGTPSGVFVANDGVHIYNEQALVHAELFSITKRADYLRTIAAEAAAKARLDVARRGLVATVVQNYVTLLTAQRHLMNAQRSLADAQQFVDITTKQERGGEVAHADVIKAQLQLQQRQRDLMDAQTNVEKARIALGVLLFADISQQFSIVDDIRAEAPLPTLDEVRQQAYAKNPDIRAAEAGVKQATYGVRSAHGAYYPSLVIDYFYGIDANVFDVRGPDNRQNLGSVVQGTVTVPVWNWGATRSKVKQAELQLQQAQSDLNFARRGLQSTIDATYLEAAAARNQLDSLRSSLELSTESLRLTVLRYQAGEATAFEVSDAQSTLAQARNAYDDGLARYRTALAALDVLTGRI